MKYAPVIIITLNRINHLKRCIESLQKNSYAKYTDLYIGLDYPPSSQYVEGYNKILEYLNSDIQGFHRVIIVRQTENKGPFHNFVELEKKVYEQHDRFIYTEDDNEFSANFLEYMDKCLDIYEDDESILAVSGYSYPIEKSDFDGNIYRCNTYFSALGYGMWRKKETKMREALNMQYFCQLYHDKKYMKNLCEVSSNQYANMVKGMLKYTKDLVIDGNLREVDLAFGLYMFAKHMYV